MGYATTAQVDAKVDKDELKDYALKTDIKEPITYTAGSNIDIIDNIISAKGYTYTSKNSFSVGSDNDTRNNKSAILLGEGLISTNEHQIIIGKYNNDLLNWSDKPSFEVGYGNSNYERKTILYLTNTGYCADVHGFEATLPKDFAEYFEWADENPNNEDRIGYMVQLNGEKIEIAESFDNCIGVVTGTAGFICDTASLEWHERYLKDEFGRIIYDTNEDGEKIERVNPEYNPDLKYIPRMYRKEWVPIGLVGKVHTRQDGTLKVGGFAGCKDGIATDAESGYRVLKIINENVALLLVK
jgi:hypothetical protein